MKLCHCGKPLHYPYPETREMMEQLIAEAGEYVDVTVPGKGTWKVQRHYVAMHGLKAAEIEQLGFEKVK